MMRDDEKYKSMVSAFRMSELQSLMSFAGKSKAGKKSELQVTRNDNIKYLISVKNVKNLVTDLQYTNLILPII